MNSSLSRPRVSPSWTNGGWCRCNPKLGGAHRGLWAKLGRPRGQEVGPCSKRIETLSQISSGAWRSQNLLLSVYIMQLNLSFWQQPFLLVNWVGAGVGRVGKGGSRESSCCKDGTECWGRGCFFSVCSSPGPSLWIQILFPSLGRVEKSGKSFWA